MLSESKGRGKGRLRAAEQLLILAAFTPFLVTSAAASGIAGTWKAIETSPPDSRVSAATLTITEIPIGVRTYNIRLDRQTTDRGLVSEEMTISCDGRSKPVGHLRNPAQFAGEADSGARVATVYCPRGGPIHIRVTQTDGMLIEHVFLPSLDGTLKYTKTTYGHDRNYVFARQ